MDKSHKKIKLGWIGAGFVSQVAHLSSYAEIPEAEIIALAELRPQLGSKVCERFGIQSYYRDHKKLLEGEKLDAVIAIVGRKNIFPIAKDILNFGYDLFTEKPMSSTLNQAKSLVNIADTKGCRYTIGYMRRHDQGVQIAKIKLAEFLESGVLGDIVFCRAYCFGGNDYCNISGFIQTNEPYPDIKPSQIAPEWVPEKLKKDFDKFLNVYVHDINLIRYLFDIEPKVKYVDYRNVSGSVILDFDKFPGVLEFGYIDQNRWYEGIDIYFSKGRMRLVLPPAFLRNQPAVVEIYKENLNSHPATIYPAADWTWSFQRQANAFVQDILNDNESIANAKDGLNDLRIVEEIWKHIV